MIIYSNYSVTNELQVSYSFNEIYSCFRGNKLSHFLTVDEWELVDLLPDKTLSDEHQIYFGFVLSASNVLLITIKSDNVSILPAAKERIESLFKRRKLEDELWAVIHQQNKLFVDLQQKQNGENILNFTIIYLLHHFEYDFYVKNNYNYRNVEQNGPQIENLRKQSCSIYCKLLTLIIKKIKSKEIDELLEIQQIYYSNVNKRKVTPRNTTYRTAHPDCKRFVRSAS